jgi:hypothetical protein
MISKALRTPFGPRGGPPGCRRHDGGARTPQSAGRNRRGAPARTRCR